MQSSVSFILSSPSAPSKDTLERDNFWSQNAERIQEKPSKIHFARSPPALEGTEEVYSLIPLPCWATPGLTLILLSSLIPAQLGCPQPWTGSKEQNCPSWQPELLCVPLALWLAVRAGCAQSSLVTGSWSHTTARRGSGGWMLPQKLVKVSAGTQVTSTSLFPPLSLHNY